MEWIFRLLVPFKVLSLEFWFYSPLLIIFIVFTALGVKTVIDDSSDTLRLGIYFSISGLSIVLFPYFLWWSRNFPAVPGAIGKQMFTKNNLDEMPSCAKQVVLSEITSKGSTFFLDKEGRRCFLRGVNFSGITKLPTNPDGNTFEVESLSNPENVSFVGRPCDLSELDVHLARMRSWGFTFLRLLITWEAVEHEGPGIYDLEYLEYLLQVVRRCEHYGISVFIDPHQDVWSRFTGGSGAPAWTLDKVGFDLELLGKSDAAVTQQHMTSIGRGKEYGRMFWTSNYGRLATSTMWTIFFAGNHFTPNLKIENESAQDYLRRHYCQMLRVVASTLSVCDNVLGFDTLNEPSTGYIKKKMKNNSKNVFFLGWRMTVWQGIKLGIGIPQRCSFFSRFGQYTRHEILNKNKVCVWKGGKENCIWLNEGLYEWKNDVPCLTKKSKGYFLKNPSTGEAVDIMEDYAIPFYKEVAEAVRKEIPRAIIFAEPILDLENPLIEEKLEIEEKDIGNGYCWAKHWYEPSSIIMQKFRKFVAIGAKMPVVNFSTDSAGLSRTNSKFLNVFKREARNSPTLLGETGMPFNLFPSPYETNDFKQCSYALNCMLTAYDMSLLSYTLWNYCPCNTNEFGDYWNKEDFSIYSLSQLDDINDLNSGGRSLNVLVRPYPLRIAGIPKYIRFEPYRKDKRFIAKWSIDSSISSNESIFFIPLLQYHTKDVKISVTNGEYTIDWKQQKLVVKHNIDETDFDITVLMTPEVGL